MACQDSRRPPPILPLAHACLSKCPSVSPVHCQWLTLGVGLDEACCRDPSWPRCGRRQTPPVPCPVLEGSLAISSASKHHSCSYVIPSAGWPQVSAWRGIGSRACRCQCPVYFSWMWPAWATRSRAWHRGYGRDILCCRDSAVLWTNRASPEKRTGPCRKWRFQNDSSAGLGLHAFLRAVVI